MTAPSDFLDLEEDGKMAKRAAEAAKRYMERNPGEWIKILEEAMVETGRCGECRGPVYACENYGGLCEDCALQEGMLE